MRPPVTPLLDQAADRGLSMATVAAELATTPTQAARWLAGLDPIPDDIAPALAVLLQPAPWSAR